MASTNRSGLANQALLDKIDKLRELNVRDLELPQLVVVGDQSSGKSSVLESLTGFAFPQGAGLCTRYATQISCRRRPEPSVSVSIIPRPNADPELVGRLRGFQVEGDTLSADVLVDCFSEANRRMGIRMSSDDGNVPQQAFSEDILKIEINGPDQEHFTVIDVPGIFRVPNPPLTTDSDVTLVRNMVESYMGNKRTIILAVLPCNVDISTQEILEMAEIADREGVRTMGVLTKPDLVLENATRDTIKELVLGKRNKLRLGYCMVKDRGADDRASTLAGRLEQERKFFSTPDWKSLSTTRRCGVGSLQARLSSLLTTITKKELPNVRNDVLNQLVAFREQLDGLGPARTDEISQRTYLGNLSTKFQAITQDALNGSYDGDHVFTAQPSLKLITTVTKMNEMFSNIFLERGEKRQTSLHGVKDDEKAYENGKKEKYDILSQRTLQDYPELCDIVEMEYYECPEPIPSDEDPITDHIERVYQENRGPELGTFSGAILAMVFKEQSEKWPLLVQAHVSKSIILVHDYIAKLLAHVCPDKQICDQLWDHLIMDAVRKAYVRAMEQTRFLLRIEREGKPSTYNHYFNSEVQKKRLTRLDAIIEEKFPHKDSTEPQLVSTTNLRSLVTDKDNMQQVREDILDVLSSYYKISRKRFVDVICRQAIGHFLLEGEESRLRVFSPELVFGLGAEQLEVIAGEDAGTRDRRAMLELEIKSLEAAMKLLRL
jgi:GTPase SAR1 family protein